MAADLIKSTDQLDFFGEAVNEANLVQQTLHDGYRGYATINYRTRDAQLQEHRFPVSKMSIVIDSYLRTKRETHDLYIAQHSYFKPSRTTAALLSLNDAHIDLDIYNTPWADRNRDYVIACILEVLEEKGISPPSYIVNSGRGLQLKWVFDKPLTPKALPRWQVVHRYLVENILCDFGADIKATLPTQIMRLVGSKNLKGSEVSIVWINGRDILNPALVDFQTLAQSILPYTQQEVKEFQKRMSQYDIWRAENTVNMSLLMASMSSAQQERLTGWKQVGKAIGMDLEPKKLASMDDLVAGEIWQRRLDLIQRLIHLRGQAGTGIPDGGHRHEFIWLVANAMAWVNRGQPVSALRKDVLGWSQLHIPSFDIQQATACFSTVLERAGQTQSWGFGLYRISELNFKEKLGITVEEAAQLSISKKSEQAERWDIGAMGFSKMKGLPHEEYKAETQRRQREAAQRTNEMVRAANAEHREKAHQLRASGIPIRQIASRLGVSSAVIHKWTKLK